MRTRTLSLALLALAAHAHANVTGPFDGHPKGIVTNAFLGANAFYSRGYTGAGVVAANIEGNLAFPGVAALDGRITQRFMGAGVGDVYNEHADDCLNLLGGYSDGGNKSTGIAYGAELWSGGFDYDGPNSANFSAYYRAMIGGVNGTGRTADVVSSSYAFNDYSTNPDGPYLAGGAFYGTMVDSVVAASRKLVVVAAGNGGYESDPDLRAPGDPASGYNTLSVGATGPDSGYRGRATFSSYGYSPYYAPAGPHDNVNDPGTYGTFRTDVPRVRVDIVAPGANIYVALPHVGPNEYEPGDGTSFSTPQVAGGAALVVQAGRALGYANVDDDRVLAAILMNSADRLPGWDNGARMVNGVWSTDQALDANVGAGQMNLTRAWDQLTGGTHDLPGLGGGAVRPIGYDFGVLGIGGANDYAMSLTAGQEFTATLRWNAEATFGTMDGDTAFGDEDLSLQLGYGALADFRLELLKADGTLLAVSDTKYIATEHFVFDIADSGAYILRVDRLDDRYNLSGLTGAEAYGLAWMQAEPQAVPEPATLAALGLGALALLRRRARK